MKKHSPAFGTIEIIITLLVLTLIGVGGWYVWNCMSANELSRVNDSAASTSEVDTYEGWLTYCDQPRNTCFRYPPGWQLTEHAGADGNVSASIASPSGTVAGSYNSQDTRDGQEVQYYIEAIEALEHEDSSLRVLGGFVAGYLPEYKVVDSSLVTQYRLPTRGEALFQATARYTNTEGTRASFSAYPTNLTRYANPEEAKKWFETDDAQAALKVVRSLQLR